MLLTNLPFTGRMDWLAAIYFIKRKKEKDMKNTGVTGKKIKSRSMGFR